MKLIILYIDTSITRMFIEKTDKDGNKKMELSTHLNFVSRGETLAKIINVDDPEDAINYVDKDYEYHKIIKFIPIGAGNGTYYDEQSSSYKASFYGFARFDKNSSKFNLVEPIQIPKNKLKVYYLVHPTKLKKLPGYDDIEEVLINRQIYSILDQKRIDKQVQEIDITIPKVHRIVAAAGKDPVNGYSEYYIPMIKIEKEAGKILEDGRIDFKEVSSVIEVKKGQEILRKHTAVEPVDGYNIFGDVAHAIIERNKGYNKGENIVQSGKDELIYISLIDGCLEIKKNKISVSPVAIINGNVDYESGNIDFDGSVHISGSVISGFSVKAKDNIKVGKYIEDATLEAGGDVEIKQGIGGKGSTTIASGGTVKAKYILNSTIESGGDITIEDSIINSNVFSNKKIIVTAKHGKILGGEATALHGIIVNESGVIKENKTVLTVGKSLFVERELEKLRKQIEPVQKNIEETTAEIKTSFGEEVFINTKEFLSILPAVRKKACLELLSKLTGINNELNVLKEKYTKERDKLKLEKDPVIVIREKVFPGTVIKIKKSVKLLEKELSNVQFYEDKELKVIKFTTANKKLTTIV